MRKTRKQRIRRQGRKSRILAYAVGVLVIKSTITFAGVEASGPYFGVPTGTPSTVAETAVGIFNPKYIKAVESAKQKGDLLTDTTVSGEVSSRADLTHIWLNADRARAGEEAPTFIALCVHEVRNDRPNDALAISTDNFRKIIREFKSQGYWFLDSNDIIAIKKGELEQPTKAVFLSFDDGYEDNYTNAYPIIREEGVKATFFLIPDYIGKENRMSIAQLKQMAAYGMCFGSHTMSHKELNNLSAEDIQKELSESKQNLEQNFGLKIDSLAYPGGFQTDNVVEKAKDNYEIAFTADMDKNIPDTAHTIHRFGVFRWSNSIDSIVKYYEG